jgi:glucose/arabinose dehydrogenase
MIPNVHVRRISRALRLCAAPAALLAIVGGCPRPNEGGGGSLALERIAGRLASPVALVAPPDGTGRLFIVDQQGVIRIVTADGELRDTPFLDLRAALVDLNPAYDERGLLGLAFHPQYAGNGRFFVIYNAPRGAALDPQFDSRLLLCEFRVSAADANVADPSSERLLLEIPKPQANHNGGQLVFGPDGYLYIGVGDGGGANDEGFGHVDGGNGQSKQTLLGKILRIDVDGGEPYGTPPTNPFVSDPDARPEIFALGLRNPWKFSFDRGGARRLFAGDVGQNLFEEIDILEPGGNYGWRIREASQCFDPANAGRPPADCPDTAADGSPLRRPIIEYAHTDETGAPFGTSVIGGFVYRGSTLPSLRDRYIFGDFSTGFITGNGRLFAAREAEDGTWSFDEILVTSAGSGRIGRFLLGFGEDASGELYVLTSNRLGPAGSGGEVWKIVPGE